MENWSYRDASATRVVGVENILCMQVFYETRVGRLIITWFKSYLNYHAQLAIEGFKGGLYRYINAWQPRKSRVGKLSYWQDIHQVVFMELSAREKVKLSASNYLLGNYLTD